MNYYIGDSINDINPNDKNVGISDDLLVFLHNNRHIFCNESFFFQEIDLYDDSVIGKAQLVSLLEMCNTILQSKVLNDYADEEDAKSITELKCLVQEAIKQNKSIVSIGE